MKFSYTGGPPGDSKVGVIFKSTISIALFTQMFRGLQQAADPYTLDPPTSGGTLLSYLKRRLTSVGRAA